MSSSSRRVWVSRCRRPTGWAGEPGSVTSTTSAISFASSSSRSTSSRRAADQRLDRPARLVGRLADLAALLGRQLGDPAQQLRQLGLAPEVLDAEALELVGGARARDRIRGRVLDLLDAVDHRAHLVHCHRRGHGRVQRLRGDRDVAHLVALGEHGVGQPFALRADHQRDVALLQLGQRPALAGGQRDPPARQLGHPAHAHHRHREDRAHRGPHGLVPVRIGAARPERDAARAERQRRAQDGADVARVAHAPQRHAQRARGLAAPSACG